MDEVIPNYYTVRELADYWRCPCSVVYKLIKSRRLRAFKLGVSWRINKDAVAECEKALEKTGGKK